MRLVVLTPLCLALACGDDEALRPATDAGSDAVTDAAAADADASSDASDGATDGGDAADAGTTHPIISASPASDFETETHVVVGKDGTLLASWIAVKSGITKVGYAFGKISGATWLPPEILESPDGRRGTDPVAGVDDSGRFFLTWAGLRRDASGLPYDMRVYAAHAEPGSTLFSAPVDVSGPVPGDSIDKPWSTTDPSGRLYVTWSDNAGARQLVSVSEDGGKTFTTSSVGNQEGYLLYPCVDRSTGRLHVVHWVNGAIGHHASDDQGKTWSSLAQVSLPAEDPASFDDPTCAAADGKLWVAYGIGKEPFDPAESPRSLHLRVARSDDGGLSFASHAFAEDPTSGTHFLHAQLARGAEGRFSLLYYAGGGQNPDPAGSLRLATSNDAEAWPSSKEQKAPLTFLGARPVQNWLGDYIGLASASGVRHVTYADNASGKSHVRYFAAP